MPEIWIPYTDKKKEKMFKLNETQKIILVWSKVIIAGIIFNLFVQLIVVILDIFSLFFFELTKRYNLLLNKWLD